MEVFGFIILSITLICSIHTALSDGTFRQNKKCSDVEILASKGLLGGWSELKDTSDYDSFSSLVVRSALVKWNQNGVPLQSEPDSDIRRVYTQVVNGLNLCIEFRARPRDCEKNEDCSKMEYECWVHAYRPFNYGLMIGGEPQSFEYGAAQCEKISDNRIPNARIIM